MLFIVYKMYFYSLEREHYCVEPKMKSALW